DGDPDGEGLALPGRARRLELLGRPPRLGAGGTARGTADLTGRPRASQRHRRSRGGGRDGDRVLRAALRAHAGGADQGGRTVGVGPMRLRDLPSCDELARGLDDPVAVDAARAVLTRAREEIRAGADPGDLHARLRRELDAVRAPRLRRVLNATGV